MLVAQSRAEICLIATALLALLLASAVYFVDRDWSNSLFLAPISGYQRARFAVFGTFGGFMPAFLHAYAVSMLLMIVLWPWRWTRTWACTLWFGLAFFLEYLQSDSGNTWLVSAQIGMGGSKFMESLSSYAMHGQFDVLDLITTGFGCVAALLVATTLAPRSKRMQP
jgi:hypothetical protein